MRLAGARLALTTVLMLSSGPLLAQRAPLSFSEVSAQSSASWTHGLRFGPKNMIDVMVGGIAAADVDLDGYPDLLVTRGDQFPTLLLRNLGNGQFTDASAAFGLSIQPPSEYVYPAGAAFADLDGDARPDLILSGLRGFGVRILRNTEAGFVDATTDFGFAGYIDNSYSAALADIDRDGDLDLALAHWDSAELGSAGGHLFENTPAGFVDIGVAAGISGYFQSLDYSFTPNFADLDADAWPDLTLAADFGTSVQFDQTTPGSFVQANAAAFSDENGMGAAIGDFDNDGDLDWFVSSIWDPDGNAEGSWGVSGNRLYANDGKGALSDVSLAAGVREGYWGWGACFADFDLDGHLDLFHVNGMDAPGAGEFAADPAALYINQGDGSFVEGAASAGIADQGQGRGIVCFDYDNDGDVDIAILNNQGPGRLYRNDTASGNHFLGVRVRGCHGNSQGIGARVSLSAGGVTQLREVAIANHYLSTSPPDLRFGLGTASVVDELRVVWPHGEERVLSALGTDQILVIGCDPVFGDGFESASSVEGLVPSVARIPGW